MHRDTHGEADTPWLVGALLQASVQSTYLRKETMVVLEDGLWTAHHIHELHGSRGGDERRVIKRALHDEALLPFIGCEPAAQKSMVHDL
jgi:hypothetical protein